MAKYNLKNMKRKYCFNHKTDKMVEAGKPICKNTNCLTIAIYGDEGQKPDITQITPTLTQGGYAEIFALVRENILSGHQIPDPSLIGLPTGSGFSSQADQLLTAYNLFMRTTILPMQEFLIRELRGPIQLLYPNQEINLEINQNSIV